MDKYIVKLMPKASRDLDEIFDYLSIEKEIPEIALNFANELEEAILSLENMPFRGSERKIGVYNNKGYRQIFVKNFTVVYRIDNKRHYLLGISKPDFIRLFDSYAILLF